MKKKLTALLLILSFILGVFSFSAVAVDKSDSENVSGYIKQGYKVESVNGDVTAYSRIVTRQQALEKIMMTKDVSFNKAFALLKEAEHQNNKIEANSNYYYKEIILVNNFGSNYLVEAGCLINIWFDGNGHEVISSIVADWTVPSGYVKTYTWTEAYRTVVIHETNKVYISTRGAIQILSNYERRVKSWDFAYYHPMV